MNNFFKKICEPISVKHGFGVSGLTCLLAAKDCVSLVATNSLLSLNIRCTFRAQILPIAAA